MYEAFTLFFESIKMSRANLVLGTGKINTADFRFRRTLSAGPASISSGQQDVGYESVAT